MIRAHLFSWKSFSYSLIAFILVGGAVAITTANLESQMDIRLYDESYYLTQGLLWSIDSWEPDYSPLYSLYYKGLSQIEAEPIPLYYLNYRVWAVVFGLCIFSVLSAYGTSSWLAWIWAITGVCSGLCLPLWPKAGHMAMFGVSILLIAFQRFRRSQFEFLILSTLSCLVLAWVRPEFFAGGLMGLVLIGLCWWRGGLSFDQSYREPKKETQTAPPDWPPKMKRGLIFLTFIFMVGFMLLWGFPVGRSGRGMVAFGQHFVHNWHNMRGLKTDILFDWVNWRSIIVEVFGSADSVVSALIHNPNAFAQHLWFNLKYLVFNCFTLFSETLFPFRVFHTSIALLITLLVFFCEWRNGFKGLSNVAERTLKFFKSDGLYLLPLALPSLIAGIIFQPRPHYILPLFPFFLVFAARLSMEYPFTRISNAVRSSFAVASITALFLFMPGTDGFFRVETKAGNHESTGGLDEYFSPVTTEKMVGKDLINKILRTENIAGKTVFDGSTGVLDYLGAKVHQKGKIGFEMDYSTIEPLNTFLEREHIEVVYLAASLRYDYFFQHDPYWQHLKAQPEKYGWIKESISGSIDSLLIRHQ